MDSKIKFSSKKRFWIGIGACALVGVIAATIAYFSSSHMFTNEFKSLNYNVEVYDLIDAATAGDMWPGETIDTSVKVKNSGEVPALVRIKYPAMALSDEEKNKKFTLEEAKNTDGISLSDEDNGYGLIATFDTDKFLYNSQDKCYYYQGVVAPNAEVSHIKGITVGKDVKITQSGYLDSASDGTTQPWTDSSKWSSTTDKGYGHMRRYSNSPWHSLLGVYAETIQATDANGELLVGEKVSQLDAAGLKNLWKNLGKTD